jgi:molybdopterin-guanine dinucleotide biosynthesis protein A
VPVVPEVFAEQYRQMMKDHIQAISSRCADSRIDYLQLTTTQPLDEALSHYLGNRERLMRVR